MQGGSTQKAFPFRYQLNQRVEESQPQVYEMVGKSIIRRILWLYDFNLQENVKKPLCFSNYLFLSSRFVKGVPAFLIGSYTKTVYIEDITQWRKDMNFIFEEQNNTHNILRTSTARS